MTDTLFTIPHSATRHSNRRHFLLPSMGFACGRIMLDDDCLDDPWVMGPQDWCWVTCLECRAPGLREVRRITHRQQSPETHVCDESCAWQQERAL